MMSVGGRGNDTPISDSWRAWSEEAIHVKLKLPGSDQEQLGSVMRVKSATGNCSTEYFT